MLMAICRIASILVVVLFSAQVKAEEGEQLVVQVHPGWGQWKTITNRATPQLLFVERIPETQNVQSIRDMVIEQTISGLPPQVTPAIALSSVHRGVASACESSRINGPTVRTENGYPVAYGQFYCTKQKGAPYGVVAVQKFIRGKEKLYVVQREWRLPPFEFEVAGGTAGVISSKYFPSPEALLAWFDAVNISMEYLGKQVVVCDSLDENKACPKAP